MQSIAIDTETTGISYYDLPFAVSLCEENGEVTLFEWDVNPKTGKPVVKKSDIREIKKRCKDKQLIFHNQNFDVSMLEKIGCKLRWRHNSFDTSVESHIINSQTHRLPEISGRLKPLALNYIDIHDDDEQDLRKAVTAARKIATQLKWKIPKKKTTGKKDHIERSYWVPRAVAKHLKYEPDHPWWNVLSKYANTDTRRTMALHILFSHIKDGWKENDARHHIWDREREITICLYDLQNHGLPVFSRKIHTEIQRLEKTTSEAIEIMQSILGNRIKNFNVNSSDQLSVALFDILNFPVNKVTKTGNPCTDKDVREELVNYVNMRTLKTSKGRQRKKFVLAWDLYKQKITALKYLHSYEDFVFDGHVYPSLDQTGTSTTRLASRNPNGQNVKKGERDNQGNIIVEGLRGVFGPKRNRIWYCLDYSQLQLRIFAYLTEEQSMIDAFNAGWDFHGFIASKIFNKEIDQVTALERRIGKNVNFGFIFGASPSKIESTAGVKGLWNTVCKMFPSAHAYMTSIKQQVKRRGYITTPHGYRLYVDSQHKGVNYIIQGCEGDIVKEGMILSENYLSDLQAEGFNGHMTFQVHDELIFDFPRNDERNESAIHNIKSLMEQPGTDINMVTPVDIEYTKTDWSKTRKLELVNV